MTKNELTIETLRDRIAELVGERQRLRSEHAPAAELEQNRREIATLQHELSRALIAFHLPAAQPGLA